MRWFWRRLGRDHHPRFGTTIRDHGAPGHQLHTIVKGIDQVHDRYGAPRFRTETRQRRAGTSGDGRIRRGNPLAM